MLHLSLLCRKQHLLRIHCGNDPARCTQSTTIVFLQRKLVCGQCYRLLPNLCLIWQPRRRGRAQVAGGAAEGRRREQCQQALAGAGAGAQGPVGPERGSGASHHVSSAHRTRVSYLSASMHAFS